MTQNSEKTVYEQYITDCSRLNVPYEHIPNTTLNEKYNIDRDIHTPVGRYPTLNYFSLGINTNSLVDETLKSRRLNHKVTDGVLHQPVPFIMRLQSEDISPLEQEKYRIRTIEEHNGINYVCYRLKVFDRKESTNKLYTLNNINDVLNYNEQNMNSTEYLNPVPTSSVDLLDIDINTYITNISKLFVSLSILELEELNRNATIVYGASEEHTFTELCMYSGTEMVTEDDREVTVDIVASYFLELDLLTSDIIAKEERFYRGIELCNDTPLYV